MRRIISELPIRFKIVLNSVVTLFLISSFIFIYYPAEQRKQTQILTQQKDHGLARMVALGAAIAWESDNYRAIIEAMSRAREDSSLLYMVLLDREGNEVAIYNPRNISLDNRHLLEKDGIVEYDNRILHAMYQPVVYGDSVYGSLLLGASMSQMYANIQRNSTTTFFISLAILLAGILMSILSSRLITNPLIDLQNAAKEISKGNYGVRVDVAASDEIGVLGRAFNDMVKDINYSIIEIEKLHQNNSLILQSAGEGIYGLDHNGLTTFANQAAADMLGYEIEEMIGKHQHDLIHYKRADESHYPREKCPIYAAFTDGAERRVCEDVFWRKDGISLYVDYVSTPIWEGNKISGAVVAFQDVTGRRNAREALEESEAKSRAILSAIPDLMFQLAADGEFISYHGHNELLYSQPEDFIGRKVSDVLPKYVADKTMDSIKTILGSGDISVFEYPLQMGDHALYFELRMVADGLDRVLAIVRDITARKEAEAEREKLIRELSSAINKVKTLSGFVPICASCKKIRDDEGYWQQVEKYIADHSDAEFSHSICPDCQHRLYSELYEDAPT